VSEITSSSLNESVHTITLKNPNYKLGILINWTNAKGQAPDRSSSKVKGEYIPIYADTMVIEFRYGKVYETRQRQELYYHVTVRIIGCTAPTGPTVDIDLKHATGDFGERYEVVLFKSPIPDRVLLGNDAEADLSHLSRNSRHKESLQVVYNDQDTPADGSPLSDPPGRTRTRTRSWDALIFDGAKEQYRHWFFPSTQTTRSSLPVRTEDFIRHHGGVHPDRSGALNIQGAEIIKWSTPSGETSLTASVNTSGSSEIYIFGCHQWFPGYNGSSATDRHGGEYFFNRLFTIGDPNKYGFRRHGYYEGIGVDEEQITETRRTLRVAPKWTPKLNFARRDLFNMDVILWTKTNEVKRKLDSAKILFDAIYIQTSNYINLRGYIKYYLLEMLGIKDMPAEVSPDILQALYPDKDRDKWSKVIDMDWIHGAMSLTMLGALKGFCSILLDQNHPNITAVKTSIMANSQVEEPLSKGMIDRAYYSLEHEVVYCQKLYIMANRQTPIKPPKKTTAAERRAQLDKEHEQYVENMKQDTLPGNSGHAFRKDRIIFDEDELTPEGIQEIIEPSIFLGRGAFNVIWKAVECLKGLRDDLRPEGFGGNGYVLKKNRWYDDMTDVTDGTEVVESFIKEAIDTMHLRRGTKFGTYKGTEDNPVVDGDQGVQNNVNTPLFYIWPKPDGLLSKWVTGKRVVIPIEVQYNMGQALYQCFRIQSIMLNDQQLISIATDIARGIQYLHGCCTNEEMQLPFIHRDLKSPNILINPPPEHATEDWRPRAYLIDLGQARFIYDDGFYEGAHMTGCGTVRWMAPEIILSEAYSEKVDIFSYAMVLVELLVSHGGDPEGHLPWAATEKTRAVEVTQLPLTVSKGNLPLYQIDDAPKTFTPQSAVLRSKMRDLVEICADMEWRSRPTATHVLALLNRIATDSGVAPYVVDGVGDGAAAGVDQEVTAVKPSGQIPLEPESYERIGYLNDTYSVAMDLTMWLMNTTTPTLPSLINISFMQMTSVNEHRLTDLGVNRLELMPGNDERAAIYIYQKDSLDTADTTETTDTVDTMSWETVEPVLDSINVPAIEKLTLQQKYKGKYSHLHLLATGQKRKALESVNDEPEPQQEEHGSGPSSVKAV